MPNPKTIASAIIGARIAEIEPPPEGGGFTSYDPKTGSPTAIAAPASDSDSDLAVRCHEYGHLMLRKVQFPLFDAPQPDAIKQAVLDVHVNAFLISHGVPAVEHLPLNAPGRVRDGGVNLIDRVLVAFRSYGLVKPPPVRLPRPLRKRLKACQGKAARATTYAHLLAACEELTQICNQPEPEPGPQPQPGGDGGPEPQPERQGGARSHPKPNFKLTPREPTPELNRILARLGERERERNRKRANAAATANAASKKKHSRKHGRPYWMDMSLAYPPLERRMRQARDYGRAARPSYSVGPFKYPLRALAGIGDGKVFGAVSRGDRGTLLVDNSGSMSLKSEDLERVLEACPRMLVAAYSGNPSFNHGVLKVLAKHGRIASAKSLARDGGFNGIDGPALQWLARQPGPRFWVSDGMVNGLDGACNVQLFDECVATVKAHGIKCFYSLPDFYARKAYEPTVAAYRTATLG